MRIFIAMAALLFCISISGCGAKQGPDTSNVIPNASEYAKQESGKYSNSYFGLSMTYPADWVVAKQAEIEALKESGKKELDKNGVVSEAEANAADKNTYPLLQISQKSMSLGQQPSVIMLAERVPDSLDEKDYLFNVSSLLTRGLSPFKISRPRHEVEIGGQTWQAIEVSASGGLGAPDIQQSYVVLKRKGFILAVIKTSGDSTQTALVDGIVDSIQFEPETPSE